MIFPEHVELVSPQRMNERNAVSGVEYGTAAAYDQKKKMLQKQAVFCMTQTSPEQNGVLLSPKELDSHVPFDMNSHNHFIRIRMRHLAGAFSARAQLFLSKLQRPPTPTQSSTSSFNSSNAVSDQSLRPKGKKVQPSTSHSSSCGDCVTCTKALDPQSRAYLCWLVLVSLCFVYNCWAIPLRISFPKHTLTVWDSSLQWSAMRGVLPPTDQSTVSPHSLLSTVAIETEPGTKSNPGSQDTVLSPPSSSYLKVDSFLLKSDSHSKTSYEMKTHNDNRGFSMALTYFSRETVSPEMSTSLPPQYNPLNASKAFVNSSPNESPHENMLTSTWLTLDVLADVMYLLDVLIVQPRVSFLTENGIWAREITTTLHSYTKRKRSKLDIIALLPLDTIFYFVDNGKDHAYLRIPRFLKAGIFWEMCERLDVALASPHVVRIARTVASMLYLVHLHACAYYLFSTWEGIASNGWVFSGRGNAYIRCFYFATKTATSIGKNPKPVNEAEYLFMTWSWLSGVFVFALLIGQIRDIVATASKTRSEFQRLLDETIHYMRRIHLPEDTQKRVFQWLTHTWDHQQVLDEQEVLEWLPSKLRGDVALDVHECSLSKVHLFRHCGQQLLRQLVLKLRPVLYLPGDYICRKGEVGKEMYIIKAGIVEVVGGKKAGGSGSPDGDSEVLATLTEGSVFGEISLLDIGGGNKRTADVRSKGFSTLFVLSKADLKEALEHHPEAKQVLKEKARQLMRENADREKKLKREEKEVDMVIIKPDPNRPATPKLIDTVIQAIGTNSKAAQLLMYGSKAVNWEKDDPAARGENQSSVAIDETDVKEENGGKSDLGTQTIKPGVFGEINEIWEELDEMAKARYESYFQLPNAVTENGPSTTWSNEGDSVSSLSNGKNKFGGKKSGPRNVFEGDVTVHQRMG